MDMQRFVEELSRELGTGPVGLSASQSAQESLENLGAVWLAAAIKPRLLISEGSPCRFVLHMDHQEPMRNYQGTPVGMTQCGTVIVGDGNKKAQRERIVLPSPGILQGGGEFATGPRYDRKSVVISQIYSNAYQQVPFLLDTYRQHRSRPSDLRSANRHFDSYSTSYIGESDTTQLVMWIAMHWAESGGAESWAWRQAEIAHEAGFKLVFTFDRAAPQRQLTRALALTPDVYLVGNGLSAEHYNDFARTLIARHAITHVHIHHSMLAYSTCEELRLTYPFLHIEDSTHIAEYRGGGFVRPSIENDAHIDLHHVISPQLVDLYTDAGIQPEKIAFKPLTDLSLASGDRAQKANAPGRDRTVLTVGFLGRFSMQKRPYLFVATAAALTHLARESFRFIMQGSGELDSTIDEYIARYRMTDVIERRPWAPADRLLADLDVLLVPSENEGLTLTALEADAHRVLVVSTDVGSQRSVIADGALLPREPLAFLRQCIPLLKSLARHPRLRDQLLDEQHQKVSELSNTEPASAFYQRHYTKDVLV